MKVMLDTNILVSAFIFKSERMKELIEKLSKEHTIILCSYTINELKGLTSTKFKVKIEVLEDFLKEFPFQLVRSPQHVRKRLFEIRDENDYIILHTAIKENVDIFITGDRDFEDVAIEKPKIMSVTQFLAKF